MQQKSVKATQRSTSQRKAAKAIQVMESIKAARAVALWRHMTAKVAQRSTSLQNRLNDNSMQHELAESAQRQLNAAQHKPAEATRGQPKQHKPVEASQTGKGSSTHRPSHPRYLNARGKQNKSVKAALSYLRRLALAGLCCLSCFRYFPLNCCFR
jgi:hypothetical protein